MQTDILPLPWIKTISELIFSNTGYRAEKRMVSGDTVQDMTILLSKSYTELEDVFVNAKRKKIFK